MAIESPTVTAFLDLPADGGDFFIIGESLIGGDDVIAGDLGTDLTDVAYDIHISRGRSSELEAISPGVCTVAFRNYDRVFDGLNTSGPYYGFLKPGRPLVVSQYGQRIFTGQIDDWTPTYTPQGEALASMPAIDGLGVLARAEFDAWTTSSQKAGARVTAVLNRSEVGWPGSRRVLDTGVSTLQADSVTRGSNVLNYLQLVGVSDLGVVFCDRSGRLVFKDRYSLIAPTAALTFADDGSGVSFHGSELSSAGERFWNRVSVDRENGTAQSASDSASIEQDGPRTFSVSGLLLNSDSDSLSMATWLLNVYKDPEHRVRSLTVNVSALDASSQGSIAALDLWDVVQVTWTPLATGSQIDQLLVVEGIEHTIPFNGPHLVTFTLSPVTQSQVFIIGESLIGGTDRIAF